MFYSLLSSEDEIVNTSDDDNLEKPTEETEETEETQATEETKETEETEMFSEEKGAYIFQDDEKRLFNFLYFRLDEEEMLRALPISYDNDKNRNYLLVTFDPEGRDYLGQQTWEKVQDIVRENKMINLISTKWEDLPEEYKFEKQEYKNMVSLAQEQLV